MLTSETSTFWLYLCSPSPTPLFRQRLKYIPRIQIQIKSLCDTDDDDKVKSDVDDTDDVDDNECATTVFNDS